MTVLLANGCARRASGKTAAADSAFVRTVVELRKVGTDDVLDSAGRAAERSRVLQRRGLTPEKLEAQSRALAATPARATAVWEAISRATNGGTP